jgi:hypothetical protein
MEVHMTTSNPKLQKRGGCLLFLLSILGLFQILFAFRVLEDSAIYGELRFPAIVQVGISLVWLVIILYAGQELLRKKTYAAGLTTIIAYLLFRLAQMILFAEADYDRNRIPLLLLVMLSLLLIPLLRWLWRSGIQNERG